MSSVGNADRLNPHSADRQPTATQATAHGHALQAPALENPTDKWDLIQVRRAGDAFFVVDWQL